LAALQTWLLTSRGERPCYESTHTAVSGRASKGGGFPSARLKHD